VVGGAGDLSVQVNTGGDDSYALDDGAKIAVIGGGPTGSFFSIFALKMAQMVGKELDITIFEPKDFTREGPGGCNRCGGVISELLVQTLAIEGINLPDSVVRKGINSYKLHTNCGSTSIATPSFEKTVATVYRGGGPKGLAGSDNESFDQFLLDQAVSAGAVRDFTKVDRVEYNNGRPVLFSGERELITADLVVGAFGVNSDSAKVFENVGFGYSGPRTVSTAIAEVELPDGEILQRLGDSIHLFLVPIKGMKFAAIIPKGNHVTVCILGKNLNTKFIKRFLNDPVVTQVLPASVTEKLSCGCFPKMSTSAAKKPFTNRIVACGDAGSSRLFKDGIGAAYFMGKAAAKTAVFQGVSERHFRRHYYPVYKSLITDNYFGRVLFTFTDMFKFIKILTRTMLGTVGKEQGRKNGRATLSDILWDMFTGSERYKKVFFRAISVRMFFDMFTQMVRALVKRTS